jgi:hypothetical protein
MAGSIWPELTKEEQAEYLRRFHPDPHEELLAMVPNTVAHETGSPLYFSVTCFTSPDVIPQ